MLPPPAPTVPPPRPAVGAYNQDGATACPGTQLPKWDVATLRRNIFQEEPGAAAITVGGTFNKCSYGKSKFDKTTSFVADLVRLPCSGTRWARGEPSWQRAAAGRAAAHWGETALPRVLARAGPPLPPSVRLL